MTEREVGWLLEDLCVSLDFCLEPALRGALLAAIPSTPAAFTDAVVRAEDLDPDTMDRALLQQVAGKVAAAFAKHRDHDA